MNKPAGSFKSTYIHAMTEDIAREILSRTYKPENFTLEFCSKMEWDVVYYGSRKAFVFWVIPVSYAHN